MGHWVFGVLIDGVHPTVLLDWIIGVIGKLCSNANASFLELEDVGIYSLESVQVASSGGCPE